MSPDATLLAELSQTLLDEERVKAELRAIVRRQAELLYKLRELGYPATRVVQKVAAGWGQALAVGDRKRLARCLLKRAERATARRADLIGAHGLMRPPAASSDRGNTASEKEQNMAKLMKRVTTTTTTEYARPEDLDEFEPADDEPEIEDDVEDEADTEKKPTRRRRR